MPARVIDTGVLLVANQSSVADPACLLATIRVLKAVKAGGTVVIDDEFRILREYLRYVSTQTPGAGSAFVRWLFRVQGSRGLCEKVRLTEAGPDQFAEFPSDPRLATFDPADRKFVATACASTNDPAIANANDRGWARHKGVLEDNGVHLDFLCPRVPEVTSTSSTR